MTDVRTRAIAAMGEILGVHFEKLPSSIPLSLPLGQLADAAIGALADGEAVPVVPRYDDALAQDRRWYGWTDDISQGFPPAVGVREEAGSVVISTTVSEKDHDMVIDKAEAIDFALSVLAAAHQVP